MTDATPLESDVRGRRWNVVAVIVAAVTGAGVTLLPIVSTSITDSSGVTTSSRSSLLGNEGAGVLLVVAIPVLVIVAPLLVRALRRVRVARQVVVGLLVVMLFLGIMSIGVFFLPTLVFMILSVAATPRGDAVAPPAGGYVNRPPRSS